MAWPQGSAASNGNAGLKLQKTVDTATLTPVLALSLSVDEPQAIPGDTLTYSSTVTNTAGVLCLTGRFVATAHADTDATVVYYWDELQACLTGCGNGLGDPHWTALVAFVAARPNYQPVAPPAVTSGMSLTATRIPVSDVTYPTSGDLILGTDIGSSATAAWKYQATVSLTPTQMAVLTDPNQVQHLRDVVHFEVQPRNSQAAQPFDDRSAVREPVAGTDERRGGDEYRGHRHPPVRPDGAVHFRHHPRPGCAGAGRLGQPVDDLRGSRDRRQGDGQSS